MRAWPVIAIPLCVLTAACGESQQQPAGNATAVTTPAKISLKAIPVVPARQQTDLARISRTGKGDWDDIRERGYLRVLVARSGTHFENANGSIRGRAVDAGVALEEMVNSNGGSSRVSVVFIETAEDALVPDLLAGKGDVAANLLVTFERDDRVAFAKPLLTDIRELVVTNTNEPPVVSLEDVGGRAIHVRKSSDHYASLIRLNAQLKGINRPPARIVVAPANRTDEDLLNLVNAAKIPATLADDYVYDSCCERLPGLITNRDVAVSQGGILAWATRKDAPKLLALVNEFFSTHSFMPGVP
jgi:membrane-bound lytic murein transglycosylase MltF